MLRSVAQRLVGKAKERLRRRRLLRSIIRDARVRYPYPWDDSARVRYITGRYFVESLDQKHRAGLRCLFTRLGVLRI